MSHKLLEDLLIININKVDVEDFRANYSIDLWWKAITRHPNQQLRKAYGRKQRGTGTRGNDTTTSDTDSDLCHSDSNILDLDNQMDDYCDP